MAGLPIRSLWRILLLIWLVFRRENDTKALPLRQVTNVPERTTPCNTAETLQTS